MSSHLRERLLQTEGYWCANVWTGEAKQKNQKVNVIVVNKTRTTQASTTARVKKPISEVYFYNLHLSMIPAFKVHAFISL